eukprot:COSAG01_NODE_23690_length_805_cov_1.351275_1_plen_162_part_10
MPWCKSCNECGVVSQFNPDVREGIDDDGDKYPNWNQQSPYAGVELEAPHDSEDSDNREETGSYNGDNREDKGTDNGDKKNTHNREHSYPNLAQWQAEVAPEMTLGVPDDVEDGGTQNGESAITPSRAEAAYTSSPDSATSSVKKAFAEEARKKEAAAKRRQQ